MGRRWRALLSTLVRPWTCRVVASGLPVGGGSYPKTSWGPGPACRSTRHSRRPRNLTSRQAEHIRNDLAQLVPAAASVLPLIRPELVKGLAILLHEYLSRPRLQSSSAAFPTRSWQPCTVTAASPSGSTVPGWPRLSARRAQTRSRSSWPRHTCCLAGGQLLHAHGSRASTPRGEATQIEATLDDFAELAGRPETRRLLGQPTANGSWHLSWLSPITYACARSSIRPARTSPVSGVLSRGHYWRGLAEPGPHLP